VCGSVPPSHLQYQERKLQGTKKVNCKTWRTRGKYSAKVGVREPSDPTLPGVFPQPVRLANTRRFIQSGTGGPAWVLGQLNQLAAWRRCWHKNKQGPKGKTHNRRRSSNLRFADWISAPALIAREKSSALWSRSFAFRISGIVSVNLHSMFHRHTLLWLSTRPLILPS
jgi:hypothetical protein